jgi:2-polyprenyl-6-methoxyphenol hydroxylase-like FAD-dependent oxidoreductase
VIIAGGGASGLATAIALRKAVMLAACLQRAGGGSEQAALREYMFRRQARTTRVPAD